MPTAAPMTDSGTPLATLAAAGVLVLVQLLVPRAREAISPGSAWFQSVAGGLGLAYVFARLLPDLAQPATADQGLLGVLTRHSFLVALAGLLLYYAVLDWAQDRDRREQRRQGHPPTPWPFWASGALYLVFNLFVGYLLVHQVRPGPAELALYTVALSARYLTGEISLRDEDPRAYDRWVRWALAAAVLVGWGVGLAVDLGDAAVRVFSALLSGSIVLTSLKQQLPASGRAHVPVLGAACLAFTALLLAI
ncbi:hypothetical protein [Modestobacter roseus]|uniref:Uncharacterized protein n=1 Tax=Modestobacter roseus TaxID=1181884 RepID=A0A562IRE4_9ACTN|nr:hypothetical protein [Modestobacter roseus]MQA31971.1 hypothetical protein [Modestobacter roseus]TWH73498.1 hypothetical protein JD78_02021 [Modestobacter roseus]